MRRRLIFFFVILLIFTLRGFCTDFVTKRVHEINAELKELQSDLNLFRLGMRRIDYDTLDSQIHECFLNLDRALEIGENDETAALKLLIEVNEEISSLGHLKEESLPVEARGIWVDNVTMRTLQDIKDVEVLIGELNSINLNFIIVDAYNNGAATYPSKIAALHPEAKTYDGDVLADIIETAHKKNIEVHALINTFGIGIGVEHFLDDKLFMLDKTDSNQYYGKSGHYWISPMIPESREYVLEILKELATVYSVDGISLDYVRYDEEFGYSDYGRNLYQSLFGIDPFEIAFQNDINNFTVFKVQFINRFVERAFYELKALKPDLLLSASVGAPYVWYKLDLGQDWVNWAENRYVNFLLPMSYTADVEHYQNIVKSDLSSVKGTNYIATGLGAYLYDGTTLMQQIAAGRTTPLAGQVLFSTANMKPSHYKVLEEGIWSKPALFPLRDPQNAARESLNDLSQRLRDFFPVFSEDHDLLEEYLAELSAFEKRVSSLALRRWDTKDLKESSPDETKQLEPLLKGLSSFKGKVARDAAKDHLPTLTAERIMADISKIIAFLEPLLYTSKPFVFHPTSIL